MRKAKSPFGERLRRLLAERGMKQVDLSRKLGFSVNAASQWCRGHSEPDIETLQQIHALLGCTWEELMEGE